MHGEPPQPPGHRVLAKTARRAGVVKARRPRADDARGRSEAQRLDGGEGGATIQPTVAEHPLTLP